MDRPTGPRRALLRSLATNLIINERIETTEARAKTIKPLVEKYISLSKRNDLAARRRLLEFFYGEGPVKKMLEVIGPRYKERRGGYTRIIRTRTRQGDRARMVLLELV